MLRNRFNNTRFGVPVATTCVVFLGGRTIVKGKDVYSIISFKDFNIKKYSIEVLIIFDRRRTYFGLPVYFNYRWSFTAQVMAER